MVVMEMVRREIELRRLHQRFMAPGYYSLTFDFKSDPRQRRDVNSFAGLVALVTEHIPVICLGDMLNLALAVIFIARNAPPTAAPGKILTFAFKLHGDLLDMYVDSGLGFSFGAL